MDIVQRLKARHAGDSIASIELYGDERAVSVYLDAAREIESLRQQLAEQTSLRPVDLVDRLARITYHVRCNTNGPLTLDEWASKRIMGEEMFYAKHILELLPELNTYTPPSVEVLVEALRNAQQLIGNHSSDESEEGWLYIDAYKSISAILATYSKPITALKDCD